MNIIIWGTGIRTENNIRKHNIDLENVIGFIETEPDKQIYCNKPVWSADDLTGIQNNADYIVVMNSYYDEIVNYCIKKGVNIDKIAITDYIPIEPYKTMYNRLKNVYTVLYKEGLRRQYVVTRANEYDSVDSSRLIGKGKYTTSDYKNDYFRYRTFEMVANDLIKYRVKGDIAEFGVFRGVFSSLINEHFKDRRIFLFDTFEGFDEREAKEEVEKERCDNDFIEGHKDTTVERAVSNLPYSDKAVVCKGLFPESITEEAENTQYAFVSIDVDFEESMYQGFKFFYPRMVSGGVIFAHDYNTYYLGGVKKAVERYESEIGHRLTAVPLADRAGTLVIVKS